MIFLSKVPTSFRDILGVGLALTCLSGCEVASQSATSAPGAGTDPEFEAMAAHDPAYRMTASQIIDNYSDASCDPLYTNPTVPSDGGAPTKGWFGEIRVPPAGYRTRVADWERHIDRYVQPDAVLLEAPLYMQKLDVPTRAFSEGFPTMTGGILKNDAGDVLTEHFHLTLESGLRLGAEHEAGTYEFAVLSDDGVRLFIDDQPYLESTAVHPTKLVCGRSTVALKRGEVRGMRVEYFQGPRLHIALQLLWRKVDANSPRETLCNYESNEDWFNYHVSPPQPRARYQQLQARGWSVVPASAFVLPGYEPVNPCLSERVKEVLAD